MASPTPTSTRRVLAQMAVALALLAVLPTGSPAPAAFAPTGSRQLLLVSASAHDPTKGTVTAYVWTGTTWVRALAPMASRLGQTGVTSSPSEADGSTPTGTFAIQYAFGQADSIPSALPYRKATADDHWVDDPSSALYNTWQTGDAAGRWSSAENLDSYALAVVFDVNQHPIVPGANSAIFLHPGSDTQNGGVPGWVRV